MSQIEVGDKVRINMPNDQIHGMVGEVFKIEPNKLWPVVVTLEVAGIKTADWPFDYDELEKVDD